MTESYGKFNQNASEANKMADKSDAIFERSINEETQKEIAKYKIAIKITSYQKYERPEINTKRALEGLLFGI